MSDLEHCISAAGVPEGYTFTQEGPQIVLTFPVPPGTTSGDLELTIFGEGDRGIRAGLRGYEPVICGMMFDSVLRPDISLSDDHCAITLRKLVERDWPLLIIGSVHELIDPKSLFMCGIYDDSSARPRSAWSKFLASADRGYLPAKLLIASCLLNDSNPYNVAKNPLEGIRVLQSIPSDRLTTEIRLVLFRALAHTEQFDEARAVITEAAQTSNDAKWELVQFLKTLPDDDGRTSREIVAVLEHLAGANHAQACLELACMCARGKGVQRNGWRARELAQKAAKIDPSLPAEVPEDGIGGNLAIAGGLTVTFLAVAATIGGWLWRNQRR
jgi:hypothetical protein